MLTSITSDSPDYPRIVGVYKGTFKRPVFFELTEPVNLPMSDGSSLHIPAGYQTNFASIPRFLWGVLPPMGLAVTPASLGHDYLYDTRENPTDWKEKQRADREFLHWLMLYNPGGETANKMMYTAVKLFGRKQFREE